MQRLAVRLIIKEKLSELHSSAFEEFFQELMCLRDPGFLDVRTAGRLGDEGSDGLLLRTGKLYACYGPQSYDATKVTEKFESDLDKALSKRLDSFDTFVLSTMICAGYTRQYRNACLPPRNSTTPSTSSSSVTSTSEMKPANSLYTR